MCGARPADKPLAAPRTANHGGDGSEPVAPVPAASASEPGENRVRRIHFGSVSTGCLYLPFYHLLLVYFFSKGCDFHLRVVLPEDLQMKNARLLCSWQLRAILNGYHQIVQQRMQHSPDLLSFMMELKMILTCICGYLSQYHQVKS
uniref:FA complementation group L n=1 Tax=Ursus maritimus TaxID=29073 RepID=A0A452UYC0_URSMA